MRRRMIARCKRPWVTVIVALTVIVAVAMADEEMVAGNAAETLPEKEKVGAASKAISDRSDPPKDKQYFIYYNPRAQERDEQIVSAEQGRNSDVTPTYPLIIVPRNS